MTLKVSKSISMTGVSQINGELVATSVGNIGTEGNKNASATTSINNKDLYTANAKEVRADIAEFTELYYETQDELAAEIAAGKIEAPEYAK